MEMKECKYCKKEFLPESKQQKFCCPACRINFHNKKPLIKEKRKCIICGKKYTPWHNRQVTCGGNECVRLYKMEAKRAKRGAYSVERIKTVKKPKKKQKAWSRCTPEERWERMSLTELSAEIARLYKGMSFGKVRLLKEQGLLHKDFGKGCRK